MSSMIMMRSSLLMGFDGVGLESGEEEFSISLMRGEADILRAVNQAKTSK